MVNIFSLLHPLALEELKVPLALFLMEVFFLLMFPKSIEINYKFMMKNTYRCDTELEDLWVVGFFHVLYLPWSGCIMADGLFLWEFDVIEHPLGCDISVI